MFMVSKYISKFKRFLNIVALKHLKFIIHGSYIKQVWPTLL